MADHLLIRPKSSNPKTVARFLNLTDPGGSLSEVNERISNNLALLASTVSMRASAFARREEAIEAPVVAAMLHEITARIAVVGHLHRLLSAQPRAARAEFGPHLRELCRLFISTLSLPGQVELVELDTIDCPVTADHFLSVSLIVTEVVTNALRHAHPAGAPGKLTIACRRDSNGQVVIEVRDDGVGFPEGFDFATKGRTGARTIHMLAEQIDAEVWFESRPTGLRFELRLPEGDRLPG